MRKGIPVPKTTPARPEFSSGPCVKPPGWDPALLVRRAYLGRSHRAADPREQIRAVIRKTREILGVPDGFRIGVLPASNTGALEIALWNLLGPRPVDALAWDVFGRHWARDVREELRLADCRILEAEFGALPDLAAVRADADVVFVWNGTTSGARCPGAEWISSQRTGLALSDATSGAFAQDLDWNKLDVVTFSWQKALGGEAAHGMLMLGPRAADRLRSAPPTRGLPRMMRLASRSGRLNEELFDGATLNTPSMLCVADCLLALEWVESIGGLSAFQARCDRNFGTLQAWIDASDWAENLVSTPAWRSNTSVCIRLADPWFAGLPEPEQRSRLKAMARALEDRHAAFDIVNHRDAPPSLRIWCGGTVESEDIEALTPWLDWAWSGMRKGEIAT